MSDVLFSLQRLVAFCRPVTWGDTRTSRLHHAHRLAGIPLLRWTGRKWNEANQGGAITQRPVRPHPAAATAAR
jgi:hypothetical protein